MKLNHEKLQRYEMNNMAGFGAAAWNREEMSVKVSARPSQEGKHVVHVDHEARKRDAARNAVKAVIPETTLFEERLNWEEALLKLTTGATFFGLLYLGTS